MKITAQQITRIHTLLHSLKIMHLKADLVSGYTEGRETSTRGMTFSEAKELIEYLQKEINAFNSGEAEVMNKMRRAVISMAYEMGWAKPGDWQKAVCEIDNFCLSKHGKFNKVLNHHNYPELVQLVTQFRELYKKHLKAL